jgi:uncharacterized membrane protein YeaQ/YmgE (transglycosylase-associated protein family)
MDLVWFLLIGGAAGWLAGKFTKGSGYGVLGNIVLGIVGGVLGGYLFGLIGIGGDGKLGALATAFFGALVLLFLIGLVSGRKKG